jgi:hypothetical protein
LLRILQGVLSFLSIKVDFSVGHCTMSLLRERGFFWCQLKILMLLFRKRNSSSIKSYCFYGLCSFVILVVQIQIIDLNRCSPRDPTAVKKFLRKHAINWVQSDKPLDTPEPQSNSDDCLCLSSGRGCVNNCD